MGRRPRHDADRLLDVAVDLVAESGPSGVGMTAVARAAGAPSGSVYHRFPGRSALLAALWLRSIERFQEGFLPSMRESPQRAARHFIAWSRANPRQARLLLYRPADFDEPNWPEGIRDRLKAGNRRVAQAVHAQAERLGCAPERVIMATIDVPYAVVRRHLLSGREIPDDAVALAEECASALLP